MQPWVGSIALTDTEPNPVLDLDESIGQRVSTFRFDLTDAVSGFILGELTPLRSASLSNDMSRTTKRVLSCSLGVDDTAEINPLTDRITASMIVVGFDQVEQIRPLGRYVFTDQGDLRTTGGITSRLQLLDEMFIVDQELEKGFSSQGAVVTTIEALLDGLPLLDVLIEPSPFSAVGAWPAGTTRGQILNTLAQQGDYMPAFFDNLGRFCMIRTVNPAEQVPYLDFDRGRRVHVDSIDETSDVLQAPNRWVVVGNGGEAETGPIRGVYETPPAAPYSIASRGFAIQRTINTQVATSVQAAAMARNIGVQASLFKRTDIDTAIDPRHDTWQVIRWMELNWLETAWSMQLMDGEPMRHTLQRTYT